MQLFNETDLEQPSNMSGNHAKMLTLLADTGCSKHVLAALLDLTNVYKDHISFLTGPIIQQRSPWADTTPQWLYSAIAADRLRIILAEHQDRKTGWQVGPVELTTVMYPATMDAPMPMEYSDIYLWASAQANARHQGITPDEFWSKFGGDPIADKLITNPSGRYHNEYRQLCSDIRRRVVNAATTCTKATETPDTEPAVTTEQFSLFKTCS